MSLEALKLVTNLYKVVAFLGLFLVLELILSFSLSHRKVECKIQESTQLLNSLEEIDYFFEISWISLSWREIDFLLCSLGKSIKAYLPSYKETRQFYISFIWITWKKIKQHERLYFELVVYIYKARIFIHLGYNHRMCV